MLIYLSELDLHRSYASGYNHCELKYENTLLCSEHTVPLPSSPASGSYTLTASSSVMSCESGLIIQMSDLGLNTPQALLYTLSSCGSHC